MIWFVLFFASALCASIVIMVRNRKEAKEIVVFVTIALLGCADWISILLDHKFKPTKLIGSIIDLIFFRK